MARRRIFAPDREREALYCTANGGPKQDHRDDPGAGVGALGLLAILAWLGVLAIGGGENPTELPLENYGITEDKVIDSDVSDNGLRAADLTVSSGDATSLEDYRAIARSIEDDEEYSDRDYIQHPLRQTAVWRFAQIRAGCGPYRSGAGSGE